MVTAFAAAKAKQKTGAWHKRLYNAHSRRCPSWRPGSARKTKNGFNRFKGQVATAEADGLLLTGGSDIAPEFLKQPVPDPSVLEKDVDVARDRWEFAAVDAALARGLPVLAICKGMQLLNVGLGGTLKLDIPGHKLPEQK
ncbi:MAG: hypothetical protein DMF35_09305, partial [Verrucomicrobia bacterium]